LADQCLPGDGLAHSTTSLAAAQLMIIIFLCPEASTITGLRLRLMQMRASRRSPASLFSFVARFSRSWNRVTAKSRCKDVRTPDALTRHFQLQRRFLATLRSRCHLWTDRVCLSMMLLAPCSLAAHFRCSLMRSAGKKCRVFRF